MQPDTSRAQCPVEVFLTARSLAVVFLVFVTAFGGNVQARTWRVPSEVGTITAALEDSAAYGDTVLVAPGRYDPASGELFPLAMKNGVVLHSEFAAAATILDANGTNRVLDCLQLDSNTVISGFTITGGVASDGGGLYCQDSYVQIMDNVIQANTADGATGGGGGIHCVGGAPDIVGNRITANTSLYFGGGIYCGYCSACIAENVISRNESPYGGGVFNDHSSPLIRQNRVEDNYAIQTGAGLDCYMGSSPIITANVVMGNYADLNGAGIACCFDSSPTVMYNTIVGNGGEYGGGVRTLGNSSPSVHGNIIVDNVDGLFLVDDSGPMAATYNHIYCNTQRTGDYEVVNHTSHHIDLSNNFWWIDDAFSIASLIVGGSNFIPFLPAAIDSVPGEPATVMTVTAMADSSYTNPISSSVGIGDTLFIQLTGIDWNGSFVEPALVMVASQKDPLGIGVALMETGAATGLYRGIALVSSQSSDVKDHIGVYSQDSLILWSHVDSTKGDTVAVGVTGLEDSEGSQKRPTPALFQLHQNYPNPFNAGTEIRYQIPVADVTVLRIYNTAGQLVRTMVEDFQDAGAYAFRWDGLNQWGGRVSASIYIVSLQSGDFSATRKMILLR